MRGASGLRERGGHGEANQASMVWGTAVSLLRFLLAFALLHLLFETHI